MARQGSSASECTLNSRTNVPIVTLLSRPGHLEVSEALGDKIDLMMDVHGRPWYGVADATRVGQELKEYDILFCEDPVPPENVDALARVSEAINVPRAAGERSSTLWGSRELIEREIVDVVQPDMGRAGGFLQLRNLAPPSDAVVERTYVQPRPCRSRRSRPRG